VESCNRHARRRDAGRSGPLDGLAAALLADPVRDRGANSNGGIRCDHNVHDRFRPVHGGRVGILGNEVIKAEGDEPMQQADTRTQVNIAKVFGETLAWILAVLLAVVFTMAGGIKLISQQSMVQEFAQIGFGQWLRYVTGILEVSGAIGVLIPKFRFWAALQIAAVMVGATITNLAILHMLGTAGLTGVLLLLSLALAWLRRPQTSH